MIAIDTNVLLSYLLHDDEIQAHKASKLIAGDDLTFISHVVLVETVWTLVGKKYKATPDDIHKALATLFSEENIIIQESEVVWRALVDYQKYRNEPSKKIDFPDAIIFHSGKDAAVQYDETFDGFYNFDAVARCLPGAMAP